MVVVELGVPSDVNSAPLFPEKNKTEHSMQSLVGNEESLKEIYEPIPLRTSSPCAPRVKN